MGISEGGGEPSYDFQGSLGKAAHRFAPSDADKVAEAVRNNDEQIQGTTEGDVEASGESLTVPAHIVLEPRTASQTP